jgi:HEAT repeat protein
MVWLDSVRLRSSSPRTRRKAIENLTAAGNLRGLKLLIASLADEDREVRCAAAKALAVINQELSVAARVAALGDGKAVYDTSTATALNAVQDPRRSKSTMTTMKTMKFTAISANRLTAVPAPANGASHAETATLLEDLGDPDVRVRLPAAQALEQLANPAHLNHFLALMADDNFEVRLAAVYFLRRLGDPVLAQALLPRLADPDSDVRLAAAQALGTIRNPAALEPLVLALTDEEQAVRQAVVAALEQIDGRWVRSLAAQRAVPRLQEMRKDPRPWVGAAAEKVLEKLRAANGKDTEVWKRDSGIRQL